MTMMKCTVMQHMELISRTLKCGKRTPEHARELTVLLVLKTDQLHIVGMTPEGAEQESQQIYFEY